MTPPTRSRRAAARSGRPGSARRIAAVATALAVAAAFVGGGPGAGAQASFITVAVRTDPTTPQPGDDVSVTVRVASCPPGNSVVELLLASTDQRNATSAATMAEVSARTSLLWRTKADLELPDAIEGWYGVRVRCGTFVPERVPMANTYFAVGANPTKVARLSADEVVEGGTLRFEGNGCPGPTVEFEVENYSGRASAFIPTGTIPVGDDGSWAADIPFDVSLTPGRAVVTARCAIQNRYGETVYISYGRPIDVTVLRAPDAPAG